MRFEVYDEDGLFSIVNTDIYKTFVDEDWNLDQLLEHLVAEMNNQSIIIWQINGNGGGKWNIDVLDQPTTKPAFRSFSKSIEVTNGELHLVNYTDLTMAAQFDDVTLPAKENADWKIALPNGIYQITVRQMFDPADHNVEPTNSTDFEIIINSSNAQDEQVTQKVFWFEEYP